MESLSWETNLAKFEGTTEWKITKSKTDTKTVLNRLAENYGKLVVEEKKGWTDFPRAEIQVCYLRNVKDTWPEWEQKGVHVFEEKLLGQKNLSLQTKNASE